jgi:lysophospholipase L1-like esterase/predicted esterase
MMSKIKLLFIFLYLLLCLSCFAQKRFKTEIFSSIDSFTNIQYGEAVNIKGNNEKLLLDIYSPPVSDTIKKRPLFIYIHGGGFKNGSKASSFIFLACNGMAKRGYVSASIDYRLGINEPKSNTDYFEAMYRAVQDAKAAVRFFRRYAEKYGIDTSQIFLMGQSAGAITALHLAYLDQYEVPEFIDVNKMSTLEGNSGNNGFSSKVTGVINGWGAIVNYKWLNTGDVPLFNIAGTSDKTVPYDSSFDYHGFGQGSLILYERMLSLGIPTGLKPFNNTGHTLDNNKAKQDSAIQSMAAWLYTQLKIVKGTNEEGVLRWEKEINSFDSLNAVEKYSDKAIMFLGSSYIRLWNNIRKDIKYKEIIHRGFGGCNFRDVAFYIKRIVYPHQPKALFIYVGNDITAGEKDKAPDQVMELIKYIIKVLREKYPVTPITFLAISPSEKRWDAWEKVQTANAMIKSYCETKPNLYFINAGNNFLGKDGKPISALFRDDKLHYNEEGYKVWGKNIQKRVKNILKNKH